LPQELEITCIVHDSREVIIRVGIGSSRTQYSVQEVVDWIRTEKYQLYTYKAGMKARVYARQHPTSGRWFLTTDPDSTLENNLDFLSHC
jgi:hypothetical protein